MKRQRKIKIKASARGNEYSEEQLSDDTRIRKTDEMSTEEPYGRGQSGYQNGNQGFQGFINGNALQGVKSYSKLMVAQGTMITDPRKSQDSS